MAKRENEIGMVCLLSTRSAIGDGFLDLVNSFPAERAVSLIKADVYENHEFFREANAIETISLRKGKLGFRAWLSFLISCVRFVFNRPAKVFIYGVSPLNYLFLFLSYGKSVYVWLHDPTLHPKSKFSEKISRLMLKIFLRLTKNIVFVVSNNGLISDVHENYGANLKVEVVMFPYISNIVENGLIEENKNIGRGVVRVLFFGRVEFYKGLDILVGYFQASEWLRNNVQLTIVGKGNVLIPEALSGVCLRNDQYVSDDFLKKLILDSDFCVFPYRSATGTQAVQTALALGCPCIVSRVPLFSELSHLVKNSALTFFDDLSGFEDILLKYKDISVERKLFRRERISSESLSVFDVKKFGLALSKLIP